MLVGGGDLVHLNEVSVSRTLVAQPSSVGFGRIALTESGGAAAVRRPGAVIVTDDGLCRAVAESDAVNRHCGTSPSWLHSLLIGHLILDLCQTFLCFPDQIFNDCNCQSIGYSVSNGQKAIKFAQQPIPLVHCVNLSLEAAVIRYLG
jgi:hypothetical protein